MSRRERERARARTKERVIRIYYYTYIYEYGGDDSGVKPRVRRCRSRHDDRYCFGGRQKKKIIIKTKQNKK